jgi:radical SAM protein with 4Fe4S-binding SPASM domain
MPFETAKKFIDMILTGNDYINSTISPGVIIEFIGGEPFLQIDLIDQITEYFIMQMIKRHHPWRNKYMISICSNGVLYFDPRVQTYIQRHFNRLSFSISIDGNKKLHDSCRVFPDGRGSYDIAIRGVEHFTKVLGGQMGSKMTLAPSNINYTYDAVVAMIEKGYTDINLNCIYEKGWDNVHALTLYMELKRLADYLIKNNLNDKVDISILNNPVGTPKSPLDLENWCFREGTMILTPNGEVPIENLSVGDLVIGSDGLPHSISNTMHRVSRDNASIKAAGISKTFTTKDHPYLVKRFSYIANTGVYIYKEPEWVKVIDIKKDDKIALYKNGCLDWAEVYTVSDEGSYEVYNITVEGVHTYIANGAVVHNCGGTGSMISVDYKGDIYPCIRYMESSLGTSIPPITIGNVDTGIVNTDKDKETVAMLKAIDRKTQSTEKCFTCPIAEGCSWCSANNYQETGSVNKRVIHICIMHQARVLANYYYWNKLACMEKSKTYRKIYIP